MPVITSTMNPPTHNDPGVQRLLSSLDQLQSKVSGRDLDLLFLKNLFQSTDFQALLKLHHKVTTYETQESPTPEANNAVHLTNQVYEDLRLHSQQAEIRELINILAKPHVQAFLDTHDKVASKDYLPKLPEIPHEVDEDEESIKIVRLVKSNEPLGATIKQDVRTGTIHIARVMHGGAADRSGLIHVGDQVQEVNDISVAGKKPDDILHILSNSVGPLTLKLVPNCGDNNLYRESKTRVRAHFDYNPSEDTLIPCKEAGLAFRKGDILHIVNQDDPSWWQARREGDRKIRAGLIPGRQLQERKEALKSSTGSPDLGIRDKNNKPVKCTGKFSPKVTKKTKRTKKIMYHAIQNDDYDAEEIITYEDVEQYYPRSENFRPIVLIGPPGVGRNELKRRLIASNPDHFKGTIPYTSRPKKSTELDGHEYFFMTKQDMEKDIQIKKFVEYGEYKGHLYGTSLESIKSIVNAGQVCVLCPHPQALKLLRTPELKPYIIFIKPPSYEKLKETRLAQKAKSTFDEHSTRPFTDEEFQDMIKGSAKITTTYGHYFDATIINEDLNAAFKELCIAAHTSEAEPHWVPASWVR